MILPVIFLSLPFLLVELHIPHATYLSYLIIILFTLVYGSKIQISNYPGIVSAYIILIITSLFRIDQYSIFMLLDVGLLIVGCLPFLFCSRFKVNAKTLNIVLIILFFLSYGNSLFSVHVDTESLMNSDIGLESMYLSFVIPLFAVYWYEKKQKKLCLINFFLGIVAGKRIVMLATILALLLMKFFRDKEKKQSIVLLTLELSAIILSILVVIAFVEGYFDGIIYEWTGLPADHFTMGRKTLYSFVIGGQDNFTMWGIGMGNTKELLMMGRLHNDILRIYVENGALVFFVFFFVMLKNVELRDLPYYLYILIVFLTDNTLIYAPIQVIYILFISRRKHFEEDTYIINPQKLVKPNIPISSIT